MNNSFFLSAVAESSIILTRCGVSATRLFCLVCKGCFCFDVLRMYDLTSDGGSKSLYRDHKTCN